MRGFRRAALVAANPTTGRNGASLNTVERRRRIVLRILSVLSLVAAATSIVSASAQAAVNPLNNPVHNVAEGAAFSVACSVVISRPAQTKCLHAALPRFDAARKSEGLGPLVLQTSFVAMPVGQQLLVLVNLERVARGLSPAIGLTATASRDAMVGARLAEDPPITGTVFTSDLVVNSNSALLSVFLWVYDDGWGGTRAKTSNRDCITATTVACWGHRDSVLTYSDGFGIDTGFGPGSALILGAATAHVRGWWTTTVAFGSASFGTPSARTSTELVAYSDASGRVVSTTALAGYFSSILTRDATHVWVLNQRTASSAGSVSEVDVATGAVARTITDASINGPVAISSDATHVWVANALGGANGSGTITEIDVTTGSVVAVLDDPSIAGPMAVLSDGANVWVASSYGGAGAGSVSEFSAATGTLETVIEDPSFDGPSALLGTGSDVWVLSSTGSGAMTEIDTATAKVTKVISGGASGAPESAVVSGNVLVELFSTQRTLPCGGAMTCQYSGASAVGTFSTLSGQPTSRPVLVPGVTALGGGTSWWMISTSGLGLTMGSIDKWSPTTGKVTQTLHCPKSAQLPYAAVTTPGLVWVACQNLTLPTLVGPNWFSLRSR